jgi:hypothetical protein
MEPVDTIVRELESALGLPGAPAEAGSSVSVGSAARPDGGALAMPQARFEELRAQAAASCRSVRGARVAAMQIEASSWDVRGARHIIDLLTRVRHYPEETHAA